MDSLQKIKHKYYEIKSKLKVEYAKFEDVSQAVKENALRFIAASDFRETLDTKPLSLQEFKFSYFNDRLPGKESSHVNYEVRKILDKIAIPLSERFGGRFIPDGSSADGTKVIKPNEFDYLYEIGIYPVELTHMRDGLTCDVSHNGTPLSSAEIFQQFSDKICEIVKEFPESDLDHGGFANPRFSGIRINAPAVTLLFMWKAIDTYLLSVDIAVGIRIPDHEHNNILGDQNNVNRVLLKYIERDNPWFTVSKNFHLVSAIPPSVSWNITASCFESNVMSALPAECPFKQAIRITKIICHDVVDQIWSSKLDGKPLGYPFRDLHAIEEVNVTLDTQRLETLSQSMAYVHIMQSYEDAVKRNEIPIREVTLNSFAIKQLAFKEACRTPGAFGHEPLDAIVHKLLLAIWKSLSEEKLFHIPHCFLSYRVRIISISSIAADHWLYLNLIIKEQCRQIHQKLSGQLLEPYQVEKLLPGRIELKSVFKGATAQEQVQFISKLEASLVHLLELLQQHEPANPVWVEEMVNLPPEIHQQKPDFCLRGYNNVTIRGNTEPTTPYSVLLIMNPVGKHLAPLYDKVEQKKPLMQKLTEHLKDFRGQEVTDTIYILLHENSVLRFRSLLRIFIIKFVR